MSGETTGNKHHVGIIARYNGYLGMLRKVTCGFQSGGGPHRMRDKVVVAAKCLTHLQPWIKPNRYCRNVYILVHTDLTSDVASLDIVYDISLMLVLILCPGQRVCPAFLALVTLFRDSQSRNALNASQSLVWTIASSSQDGADREEWCTI